MKVAVISTMKEVPWGGSELLWAATVDQAIRQRMQVVISVYHWPKLHQELHDWKNQGVQILTRRRKPYVSLRLGRFIQTLRSPFQAVFDFQPDVICISQGGTFDSVHHIGLASLLQTRSIPYVVVCQANHEHYVPADWEREEARKFFREAYRVTFVAQGNWELAERQLAATIDNGVVLRNPVNMAEKTELPWPAGSDIQMACVARLDAENKGQDVLLSVLRTAVWRERKWRLNLYGSGKHAKYLAELARYYDIAERVHFAGYVDDVRSIWAQNHLLVIPSRMEGTPLAMVEAMLCGRPVVGTDVGGIAEWIQEGINGYLAPAPTRRSLAATLERAWSDRDDWEEVGQRAHQFANERIDADPGTALLRLISQAGGAAESQHVTPLASVH